jgi:Casein kinase substrate phosphoprotein PP28./SAP domain.
MGRDKGKFNKRGGRGGGSRFQAMSAEEIEARNNRIAEFDEMRAQRRAEADDEEPGEGEIADGVEEVTRVVDDLNVNEEPNGGEGEVQLTRKQREQADKERKAAEYRRRHELGLTEEYKRDMAKLAEVRKRREEAAKKSAEEKAAAEAFEAERKAQLEKVNANVDSDSDDSDAEDEKKKKKKSKKKIDLPKLDKITIKKMKPAQLKEALKERGCDIQGNAKTLTARLLEFEGSR